MTNAREVDDAGVEDWASVLRRALASKGRVTGAPQGWPGWSLAAGLLTGPDTLVALLWEPGAPRPEGRATPHPDHTPTILLALLRAGDGPGVYGEDRTSPGMRTDQETASTVMALVIRAWLFLSRERTP